jgi:flagellar protein FliL
MAKREDEELEQAAVATPPRKGRSRLVIALVAGVLVIGGGYAFMRGHQGAAAPVAGKAGKSARGAKAPALPEFYLPLEPAFVVNFRDDDSLRYLQVGVSLMSHDQAALTVAKDADPVIRDALVMLFSRQDYSILSDPAGKQKLQVEALAAVRKIVGARLGRPGIDALYFTSFVMQ